MIKKRDQVPAEHLQHDRVQAAEQEQNEGRRGAGSVEPVQGEGKAGG